ncbi:non-homologous end-joining DNA ligase [Luteipulveratus sp. YIM 133132]|uniref:non-homologous end-joining DNA ligase n=1 Tax=Luteipulveratus flavus TaxID=3031728 RepID=UPI0023AF0366|nr:non-homologous end-joining DNA ligase [Luteipulveratus sp. YIM 133132]MDE9364956.1 non-homologous end-joining DNA ligase [Luteipulveratus sp. YIM 133132]
MPDKEQITVQVGGRRLRLSSLDKVLFPATETTKGEVLNYYAHVAAVLLPVIEERPLTRIRWPHGVNDMSFFEKNLPSGAPSWLERVTIQGYGSRGGGDSVTYPMVDDLGALTYLVNLNSIELHVPQWRVSSDGKPVNPDRLVIDLDPGSPAGLHECAKVALLVRDRLADEGYSSVPVTSGSKGMQLYSALDGSRSSDDVREWTKGIAQELTKQMPGDVVWKMTKSLRPGKVLLDWSQNVAAKTTIAPYSLRGRDRPTVAAPRTWDEVEEGAQERDALRQLDMDEVLDRVAEHGDLFADRLT